MTWDSEMQDFREETERMGWNYNKAKENLHLLQTWEQRIEEK